MWAAAGLAADDDDVVADREHYFRVSMVSREVFDSGRQISKNETN